MKEQIKSLENILQQFGQNMNKEDRNNLKKTLRELKLRFLLSDEFKFKYRYSNTDYTAKLKDGLYEISWMEGGKKETTTYSLVKVKEYIEKGFWILQEGGLNR